MRGSEEPDELLDIGHGRRRRLSSKARLVLLLLAGALVGSLIYVTARPHHPSPRAAPATTGGRSRIATPAGLTKTVGDCLVTTASPDARPPAALHYSPPPPVPWVKDWYGNGRLWVMLPPDGRLLTWPHANGSVSTKFPFFRVAHGAVVVRAHRLDGSPGQFSAATGTVDAYGESGFVPSELTFSTPGCWRLRASVSGGPALTFTVVVNQAVVSASDLARPLRLPRLRPGQACPASGGTPVSATGPVGFGGIAQGVGPVRPIVGNGRGVARLTRIAGHPHWLAAVTLWISAPRYQGPYLVRVRRLNGTGPVGLLNTPHRTSFLAQATPTINEADGYREWVGATWMKRPGCAGWQVDGLNFSHVIVVRFTK